MKGKCLQEGELRTFAVIFDTDDEVVAGLTKFARENSLSAAHFTGLGALREVTLGYFDWQAKDYKRNPIREQVEVVAFIGDVALDENGQSKLHPHIVVSKSDGTACGGHLLEACVRPTLEVVLTETPAHLHRRTNPETGLALIKL
jgi:uncharacterized protein